ncbi:colanic acid biosynthesis glycosyltransferase WcaI [Mucilaginibacter hurinus]|uniref:Colanic acid biosynthesis glycosyltransferase WcaI n=1 Tax=Mucilaginibacter hurinus TaxID=2201324 RepID=A0A367GR18_9SPHI|nr:WcaI family glycosyltransferase [Mucilaginibacter hurinus]RCH55909.1 colanic acid biosynthesis glycosyltransferase WcaI [Mucilaginibacter hurinus]
MQKKSFLLITTNYHPEPTATGKFNGEMIEWLVKKGHNCTVITTFPHYPYWKVMPPYTNRWYKKETKSFGLPGSGLLTVYRCPHFIPKVPTGKMRLIQEFTFLFTSFFVLLGLLFKRSIDYALAVAPPFHTVYWALLYKWIKRAKVIYHIQDLQIDTAQELGMLKSSWLFDILYKNEKWVLKQADFVSSISEGMIKKLANRSGREILTFPNWVDTGFFTPMADRHKLKINWGYAADDVVLLYSGGIGEKQGLDIIVHAANISRNHKHIKFVICGSGQYKVTLEEIAAQYALTNIKFLPLQDKAHFNEFLNMGDVHLIIQKSSASDLALPSKLTNILAVGGACLVTTFPDTSLYDVVTKNNIGFTCDPDNPQSLADTILTLPADIDQQRYNARMFATRHLDIDSILNRFTHDIQA